MKIKLRDMTYEQFRKWHNACTEKVGCTGCPFVKANCEISKTNSWVNNKNLYSHRFLDQEIEIEDENLIDDETKKWLEDKIIPLGVTVVYYHNRIVKCVNGNEGHFFYVEDKKIIEKFNKLEPYKPYKIEDLIKRDNEILNLQERQYLRAVIRPFRDRVESIVKCGMYESVEYIYINVSDNQYPQVASLPLFKAGTMYKGMKAECDYTLEELGL